MYLKSTQQAEDYPYKIKCFCANLYQNHLVCLKSLPLSAADLQQSSGNNAVNVLLLICQKFFSSNGKLLTNV